MQLMYVSTFILDVLQKKKKKFSMYEGMYNDKARLPYSSSS